MESKTPSSVTAVLTATAVSGVFPDDDDVELHVLGRRLTYY